MAESESSVPAGAEIGGGTKDGGAVLLAARKQMICILSYSVLLISGLTFVVIYILFLTKVIPCLNVWEAGNWWTFLVFFLSCSITILLSGFAISMVYCRRIQLGTKTVVMINVFLLVVACYPVFLGGIGAAEYSNQRGGPRVLTTFGRYVVSVCGNSTLKVAENLEETPVPNTLNAEKCAAISTLKIGIFCTFIWPIEIAFFVFLSTCFGLQCKRRRGNGGRVDCCAK